MCGIVGILNYATRSVPDRAVLERMNDSLAHRGPDDQGIYLDPAGGCGLGFRRLSIIDLSAQGHQPMTNEDGRLWLVFNGEIYNYLDLRRELKRRGHRFRSETDSETILHGYEEWGAEVVQHLDGMFAFALWDEAHRQILVARDRFGIKPLHFALLPGTLVLGSEIKAVRQHPGVSPRLNPHAIWQYLTFGQIPAPETIYQDIRKLLPGQRMTIGTGAPALDWYYTLPQGAPVDDPEEAVAARVAELLSDSVKRHLVADVPIGCFLSGGLDSSLIAALAARHTARLKTFSVTFPGSPANDESQYQQLMARHLGSDHHSLEANARLADSIPDLLKATDEPFAISSFMPLYHVSRLARERVKVVLSGDGSDELFAGYDSRYTDDLRNPWMAPLERWLLRRADPDTVWLNRRWTGRLRRRAYLTRLRQPQRYIESYNYFTEREKALLLQPQVLAQGVPALGARIVEAFDPEEPDPLRQKLRLEFLTSLPDEMLTKVDRATSAVSIEGRVPFLDLALVNYAWRIPTALSWKAGTGKQILRRAAGNLLPKAILDRPKRGFIVPLTEWFRTDGDLVRDVLSSHHAAFDQWIRPEVVSRLLAAQAANRADLGSRLWLLCVLKAWMHAAGV